MKADIEAKVVYVRDATTRATGRKYYISKTTPLRFGGGRPPFHRKQIVITNLATGNNLIVRTQSQVGDDDGTAPLAIDTTNQTTIDDTQNSDAVTIYPKTTITLFTSDALIIWTAVATAIHPVNVLETFYT
jgi:hypothetical protein